MVALNRLPWVMLALAAVQVSGCLDAATSEPLLDSPRVPWDAFLLNEPFSKMRIEVHYSPAAKPPASALETMREAVQAMTLKDTVDLTLPLPLEGKFARKQSWTEADIHELIAHVSTAGVPPGVYGVGEEAVLHVYYLDGDYEAAYAGITIDGRTFVFPHWRNSFGAR